MKIVTEKWERLSAVRAGSGGVAVAYAENLDDIQEVLQACRTRGTTVLPLGRGTNLVGSDRMLNLTCLRLTGRGLDAADHSSPCVTARCGEPLTAMLCRCAERGLGGLSPLVGIPGTLGGALAGNAGANGHAIFEYVESAEGICLADGTPWKWTVEDGGWSYRRSPVPKNVLLTSAVLRFERCNPDEEHRLQDGILARRRQVTPPGASLGSTFKNPAPDKPAGKLLEDAGCKGLSCGVFSVSPRHANWIVNTGEGDGAAEDYRRLVDWMKQRVSERFGIRLQEEVRFVDDAL